MIIKLLKLVNNKLTKLKLRMELIQIIKDLKVKKEEDDYYNYLIILYQVLIYFYNFCSQFQLIILMPYNFIFLFK